MDRKEYQREYQKKYYEADKKRKMDKVTAHLEAKKKWFYEITSKLSCIRCGENDNRCLDFHHKDPTQKDDAVTKMVLRRLKKETILAEIEKCDVLCSNCHRKLHWEEKRRTNDV